MLFTYTPISICPMFITFFKTVIHASGIWERNAMNYACAVRSVQCQMLIINRSDSHLRTLCMIVSSGQWSAPPSWCPCHIWEQWVTMDDNGLHPQLSYLSIMSLTFQPGILKPARSRAVFSSCISMKLNKKHIKLKLKTGVNGGRFELEEDSGSGS